MKTYTKIKYALIAISTVALIFINISYALGWAIGWTILSLLKIARERFYNVALDMNKKNTGIIISYFLFTFAILWIPPLISFVYPTIISPYFMIATYALDRIELYFTNIFFPKKD